MALAPYLAHGRLASDALRQAVLARLPATFTLKRGPAQTTYALDGGAAAQQAVRDAPRGGIVDVPSRAISAQIAAPVVAQQLRDNCETAALEVLLATTGVASDQLALQSELRLDGPRDPQGAGPSQVWGDPERGFVGRADGGGPAGGFGVYQAPIAALALRHGRRLVDLTGGSPTAVYQRVLTGHAVMAWVGLANGPYGQWQTPAGRLVRVNFNEHAVVISGLTAAGIVQVINPLTGTRELWTKLTFEAMWNRLGRRALST
jgi:uncharacterized protein YvpB